MTVDAPVILLVYVYKWASIFLLVDEGDIVHIECMKYSPWTVVFHLASDSSDRVSFPVSH